MLIYLCLPTFSLGLDRNNMQPNYSIYFSWLHFLGGIAQFL